MALPEHAARLGRQALPALRRALRLRRHLPRPPRPLPLRQLRRDAPRAAGLGPRHRARRRARRALHAAHAGRAIAASRCPCPGSTTSTTRSARPRSRSRSARRSTTSSPACRPSPPRSGAPRRCGSPGATCRSCWSRTRPAPTRSCARSRSRTASTTSSPCSTTTPPTGATSAGSGTPTSRSSRRRVRRVTCSGTRAAEMALRLKYAGVPTDRIVVEPELEAGLDRALGDGDGPLFALPTYTAMLALRELLVARGAVRGSFGELDVRRPVPTDVLARPRVRRLRRSTCRCGASWPTREGAPVLDVGAGHRARRARPRPRGPRGRRRSTATPELLAALARARRAACRSSHGRGRRARLRPRPALRRWSSCRCRRSSCSAAPRAARASCACARAHLAPGGLLAVALADALEAFDGSTTSRRRPTSREVGGVVYVSRPVAVRDLGDRARHRARARDRRRATATRTVADDVIELDRVDADELGRGGRRVGLRGRAPRRDPRRPTSTSARRW